MEGIGDRIKHLRNSKKMTQPELAEATGISKGNISDLENNKVAPSAKALISLSKFFNVSSDWILTGKDYGPENNPSPRSALEQSKDLANETYLDGTKMTSKDKRILTQLIEGAIGDVMFSTKNQNEELTDDDMAMVVDAFKYSFVRMREEKKRIRNLMEKKNREKKD